MARRWRVAVLLESPSRGDREWRTARRFFTQRGARRVAKRWNTKNKRWGAFVRTVIYVAKNRTEHRSG